MSTLQITPSIASAKVVPQAARLPALDAARFAAALGVIWIHAATSPATAWTTPLARFAVPFFCAAAAFFLLVKPSNSRTSFGAFFWARIKRLYLPFIIWSAAYVLLKLSKRVLLPNADCELPGWEVFIFGGAYHLWFVPYLVVASCLLFLVGRKIDKSPIYSVYIALGCGLSGCLLAMAMTIMPTPDATWIYMLQATPGLLWGAALALVIRRDHRGNCERNELAFAAGVVFIITQSIIVREVNRSVILESAAGISLLMLAIFMPQPRLPVWCSHLGRLAFGVYLSHLLFIKVLEPVLGKFVIAPSLLSDLFVMVTAATGATILSLLLERSEKTRWLVS